MSSDRDVTRIVRSWLDDGVTQLPDRVLDAVLDQVPTTPQRRASWLTRRFPIMNNTAVRYSIAAAVVVVLALVGTRFLPSSNNVGPPGPTLTVVPSPTAIPQLNEVEGILEQGRYQVDAGLPTDVTAAVPSGGWTDNDWVLIGPRDNQAPDGMAIRFFGGALNLYNNPLQVSEGVLDPPVGPTVDDLVQAIVNHPAWTASAPSDITIDGHAGQLVTLTIPLDAPLTGPEAFYLFVDPTGGQIWGWAPGQIFDLYIIDVDGPEVDGQRLVIDAFHYPGTSEEDLAAQRAVVESVQFGSAP